MTRRRQEVAQQAVNLPEEVWQIYGKLPVEPQEVVKPAETPVESEPMGSVPPEYTEAPTNLQEGENTATVSNGQGTEIRTYTLEGHGEGYLDLAKEFANKVLAKEAEAVRHN